MAIIHCLFWIQDKKIASLIYELNQIHIMKIGGRDAVPFTEVFFKEWKDYAGMCSGDKTDFCLIYDEKPDIGFMLSEQCESKDCIWSRTKIEDAVKLLRITKPTEIRNENGDFLVKAGCFMNVKKENIIQMTAWYIKADKDSEPEAASPDKMTALVQHYKGELQLYKGSYEK